MIKLDHNNVIILSNGMLNFMTEYELGFISYKVLCVESSV
jgi:hypothetical protein